MSDENTQSNNRALGITFLTLGVGMTVSLGATLGAAFFGVGLPFIVLGIIFMSRKEDVE